MVQENSVNLTENDLESLKETSLKSTKSSKVIKDGSQIGFLEMLSKLSPGKSLRIALDDILRSECGALIVIYSSKLKGRYEGGFKVNCRFTPQRLAELAKMDGAIIISADFKKILLANVLLTPDNTIPTDETGTRHKAAKRTSVQSGTPIIAVSERKKKITLFFKDKKYLLQSSDVLLRTATETLQILEKQKELLEDLISNLNVLEITNLVSVQDVCSVLQKMEIINKMISRLKRQVLELGKEGIMLKMRLSEISMGLLERENLILKDYVSRPVSTKKFLSNLSFEELLYLDKLAKYLFNSHLESEVSSKGYRILNKTELNDKTKKALVFRFKTLNNILNTPEEELKKVLKSKATKFKEEIENLKDQIIVGKKIN